MTRITGMRAALWSDDRRSRCGVERVDADPVIMKGKGVIVARILLRANGIDDVEQRRGAAIVRVLRRRHGFRDLGEHTALVPLHKPLIDAELYQRGSHVSLHLRRDRPRMPSGRVEARGRALLRAKIRAG